MLFWSMLITERAAIFFHRRMCRDEERIQIMRRMEFKMERQGLLQVGQNVTVTEGLLPSNYYYVIDPSLAMSANIPFRYRLQSREGVVVDIVENARGFYVTAEFNEPEVDMSK